MESVSETLAQRGSRYGDFASHAQITQGLKKTMRESPNWEKLDPAKKEALEMIAHKIGRILNGDPEYADSWHDIAGYAILIEENLEGNNSPVSPTSSASVAASLPKVSATVPPPVASQPNAQQANPRPTGQPAGGPVAPLSSDRG